jgi:serine protease
MKIVSRIGSAGLLALVTLAAILSMPAQGAERGPLRKALSATAAVETEARVIVKFRADSALMRALSARSAVAGTTTAASDGPQHAQALSTRLGLALVDGRVLGARSQLVLAKGLSSKDLAARLGVQTDVEYAVVDGRMRALAAPNDPLYAGGQSGTPAAGQWYLRAPNSSSIVDATSVVSAINAEAAWAITTGKRSVVVAVLDTGVRPEHPDLVGKLLPGYDFIANADNANDGDGRDADPTDPGDGVTQADVGTVNGCVASDIGTSSWHGTQTAGLIGAATNNGEGMASVGRDVMLLPVRVLGKCGGYDSDIQAAILWAANIPVPGAPANPNPAKVINMSLGAVGSCSAAYADVLQQVANKGVVVVVAAGNDGLAVGTPANCPGVIAVGGVRHAGSKVGYSDLGPEVAISAPAGNCVNTTGTCLYPLLTTSNNGTQAPGTSIYTDGDNAISIGTSFSAPLVAGTAALMFSENELLKPRQILRAIRATARAFPFGGASPIQHGNSGPLYPVSACSAPTSVAQDYECYCTTSTCGAGLLDTGLAVAVPPMVAAGINVASINVVSGSSSVLDASESGASGMASIVGYQWAIAEGAAVASFSSATNAATATLATTAAGSVTVSLTVTDSAGQSDTTTTTLTISAPPPVVTPPSSSSGGGAMELGWLLGWLASVIGVWVVTPRPCHKAA